MQETPNNGRLRGFQLITKAGTLQSQKHLISVFTKPAAAHRAARRPRPISVKALLRRAAPNSFDAICDALKTILAKFQPAECSNYLRHSGYVQS